MNLSMAWDAKRNYIKPMFGFITLVVMILSGTIWATRTANTTRLRQDSGSNCIINRLNSPLGPKFLGMRGKISEHSFQLGSLSFFAQTIMFYSDFAFGSCLIPSINFITNNLAFFALAISMYATLAFLATSIFCGVLARTGFAFIPISVSATSIFGKFIDWFDCVALVASFRYDGLSHFRFLSKRDWLEPPFASYTLAGGSLIIPALFFPSTSRRIYAA